MKKFLRQHTPTEKNASAENKCVARSHLPRSLAFANANEECKYVIEALPDTAVQLAYELFVDNELVFL